MCQKNETLKRGKKETGCIMKNSLSYLFACIHTEYLMSYGCVTTLLSKVTAVPAISLPLIDAPVFMAIDV